MDQEKYWDSVSGEKEFYTPFQVMEFEKYVSKEMRILDVGCGYGRTLNELYNSGYKKLSGVDFSSGMAAKGIKLFPYLHIQKIEKGKLPYSDNSFDSVILIAVLTCIQDDLSQQELIEEIIRILKPGGIIYVNDYLINTDKRNFERYEKYSEIYKNYGVFELPEGALVRHHTESYIFNLFGDFEKIIYEPIVYTTMNGNKSNGFYYMGRKKEN
jgi:ubiquinone/menaquinone biosynthesis C-methylase UbiE